MTFLGSFFDVRSAAPCCLVRCSNLPESYPADASNVTFPGVTTKNVFRQFLYGQY